MHNLLQRAATGPWLRRELREGLAAVFDAVCPPHCVACGGAPPLGMLCAACRPQLETAPEVACARCGAPLVAPGAVCTADHGAVRGLAFVAAPFGYRGAAGGAVRRFKFAGDRGSGRWLARAMAVEVRGWAQRERHRVVVVGAPLAAAKRRRRGFDQAALLAQQIAQRLGLRFAPRVLARVRDTLPQGDPRVTSRQANVAGAFAVRRGRAVQGRHVLLVDDVATSLHTGRACATELRAAGARSVALLVAARGRAGS